MQRAIELGYREPRRLLRLARALNEQQRVDELWEVLELIPDDPDRPRARRRRRCTSARSR